MIPRSRINKLIAKIIESRSTGEILPEQPKDFDSGRILEWPPGRKELSKKLTAESFAIAYYAAWMNPQSREAYLNRVIHNRCLSQGYLKAARGPDAPKAFGFGIREPREQKKALLLHIPGQ